MISIPLLSVQPHPCSYLEHQIAQTAFVHPSYPMSSAIYSELIAKGFRRNGNDVYAPRCLNCNACTPARIRVADFKPSRSQSRCLTKNSLTQTIIKPASFQQQHYDLYKRYQQIKHPDSNMQYASTEDYMHFLGSDWCDTLFVEFKINQHLVAVAVIDQFDNAVSAVYTFFDMDFAEYSLGVYAVLWQLDYARCLKLEWVYLGYWIKDCPKMSYKKQYQPLEIYRNGRWVSYRPDSVD